MKLEEAIKHAKEVAKEKENEAEFGFGNAFIDRSSCLKCAEEHRQLATWLEELKALKEQTRWILVSEKLPKDLKPVNITWVNRNPESYYAGIKDKPFTATGHYCKGKWYWYSSTCEDYLKEYGRCEVDEIDADIEIIAWMPLPLPWKGESEEE